MSDSDALSGSTAPLVITPQSTNGTAHVREKMSRVSPRLAPDGMKKRWHPQSLKRHPQAKISCDCHRPTPEGSKRSPEGDRGVQTQWEKPTYREGQIPPGIQTRRERPTYRKGHISPGVQTRREKPTYREGLISPGVQTQREKTTYTEGQKSPGVRTGRPEPESWCREHRFHSFTFRQKRCQNYLQNAYWRASGN